MCKVLIGLSKSKNHQKFSQIILAQVDSLKDQKDGIGALLMSDKKIERIRNLENYDSVFKQVKKQLPHMNLVGIHTRTGTSGTRSHKNVHFFRIGDLVFAHNGIVWNNGHYESYRRRSGASIYGGSQLERIGFLSETSVKSKEETEIENCIDCVLGDHPCKKHRKLIKIESKKEVMCDSYLFLQKLSKQKEITPDVLAAVAEKENFMGVGFLVDLKNQMFYIITERTIKIHSDFKNFIVFYSYEPSDALTREKTFLGIPVNQKAQIKTYDLSAGIYDINLKEIFG